MKENYTDVTVLIDRSGSMLNLRPEVIGGFNSFMEDQRKVEGECTVSLVQFDNHYEVNYTAVPVSHVADLSYETYQPRGLTAMYDAIGKTIVATGERLSVMNEKDRPDKVIFIIQTDGAENASQEYHASTIKKMIQTQESEFKWDFVFLGANINAKSTAMHIGIKEDKAMTFANNSDGATRAFASVSSNVAQFRSGSKSDMKYSTSDYVAQSNAGVEQ